MNWLKWFLYLLIVLIFATLLLFAYKGHQSRAGQAPGLKDGRLQACPSKPNCVSSETGENPEHHIEPLTVGGTRPPLEAIVAAIDAMGGEVLVASDDYLSATFSSKVFGFVDDLELRRQGSERIYHVRSASRIGQSDMGVNRQRVEALRSRL